MLLKFKSCPNCNSNNIKFIINRKLQYFNLAMSIFFLIFTIPFISEFSKHPFFLGSIFLLAILNLWILQFNIGRFYICNTCDLEFNYNTKSKCIIEYQYDTKELKDDSFLNFDILFKVFIRQISVYCIVGFSLIIIFSILINSDSNSSIYTLIYIFISIPVGAALICVYSVESENSIARTLKLKRNEIEFKQVYSALAKFLTLLTTFYTIAFTRISHTEIFNFDIFLWTNIFIFTIALSNFILEFNHYRNN